MEQDSNHIHILCSFKPKFGISQIIKEIKQKTTPIHPDVYWGKKNKLWSRGYFCSTVGNVSAFKIQEYIKKQNV